jgi:hypothetical protein
MLIVSLVGDVMSGLPIFGAITRATSRENPESDLEPIVPLALMQVLLYGLLAVSLVVTLLGLFAVV